MASLSNIIFLHHKEQYNYKIDDKISNMIKIFL